MSPITRDIDKRMIWIKIKLTDTCQTRFFQFTKICKSFYIQIFYKVVFGKIMFFFFILNENLFSDEFE